MTMKRLAVRSTARPVSIFSDLAARARTVQGPPSEEEILVEEEAPPSAPRWCAGAREHEILAVLADPPGCNERVATAFERKERELTDLFAQLHPNEARALHRRLTIPAPSDPIALKFGRLVIDRRQRLIAFLAGAPRREALRQQDVKRRGGE